MLPDPEFVARSWYARERSGAPWESLDAAVQARYRHWAARALAGWPAQEFYEEWRELSDNGLTPWEGLTMKARLRICRIHLVATAHTLGVLGLLDCSSVTAT